MFWIRIPNVLESRTQVGVGALRRSSLGLSMVLNAGAGPSF